MIPLVIAVTIFERGRVGGRWILATGTAIGLSYYAGFPQGWVYNLCVFMLVLLVLVWTKACPSPGFILP